MQDQLLPTRLVAGVLATALLAACGPGGLSDADAEACDRTVGAVSMAGLTIDADESTIETVAALLAATLVEVERAAGRADDATIRDLGSGIDDLVGDPRQAGETLGELLNVCAERGHEGSAELLDR